MGTLHENPWLKIDTSGGEDACHLWTGALNREGFGMLRRPMVAGKRSWAMAHRRAWELTYGEIPSEKVVLQVCYERRCCNVAHLALGTRHQVEQDKSFRELGNAGKRACPNGHSYTADNTIARYPSEFGRNVNRNCRACTKAQANERNRNKRAFPLIVYDLCMSRMRVGLAIR